ncbi:MAG TPA: phage major capsid protein [Rectinema sp.]|jgi:HK97 family phage major capsid protein|nr:phage major capsid protein [Rectinema sp.]
MDSDVKEMLDNLGKEWKAFRDTNDQRLAAIEAKQGHAELDAKLAAIEKELNETKAQINRVMLGARLGGADEKSELYRAFTDWMRDPGRSQQFKAAVQVQTGGDGGYLVLPELEKTLQRVVSDSVAMRQLANVVTIGSKSYLKNINKGGITGGWATEGGTRTGNATTPAIAQIEIIPRELYALPSASQEALDDLDFDVAAWLAEEAGITFASLEDAGFISGDGNGKPKGFLAETMVANSSWTWEKIGYILSGAAGAFPTTHPGDVLIDLIYALKAGYRNGAAWLMNDLTQSVVRKFKDGQGNYLWQPSFQLGKPDTLCGYPVMISDSMPDIAADAYAIAFGNFKLGYQIVDRKGVRVLADPYTTKGAVTFYTYKRVGGAVADYNAIKVIKFAAS